MSFVHPDFLWFFPLVWCAWWFLRGRYAMRVALLLVASLVFYGWRRSAVVPIILMYALVDWAVGMWLQRTSRRRLVLTLGLTFNLGVLCFWKYTPLLVDTLGRWLGDPAWGASMTDPAHWIIPMGVSFYSFTGIAYMVDVYRRVTPVERSLRRFALFTCF